MGIRFQPKQKIAYPYQISLSRKVNGKAQKLDLGEGYDEYNLLKNYWDKPGIYDIRFTPKLVTPGGNPTKLLFEKSTTFRFEILPPLNLQRTFSTKELAIYLLLVCLILGAISGGLFTYIKRRNKKKLAENEQQKKTAKLQLSSIRSQLNPHFMFNALAGIQSLMNQNKVEEANEYLNRFSRLTRNVLDQKDLISLAEERDLLNDYLQMEQYRFGFSYEVKVEDQVDLNIEIPAMLLQPLVENAVKHGISSKANEGHIVVAFEIVQNDLILKVDDNGDGFDSSKTFDGLGLQLTKNRIELLGAIYPEASFVLKLESNKLGTQIQITLNGWL